jgi:hypothetical protein
MCALSADSGCLLSRCGRNLAMLQIRSQIAENVS